MSAPLDDDFVIPPSGLVDVDDTPIVLLDDERARIAGAPGLDAAEENALAIEAELIERHLCFRRLQAFTGRCTPGFLDGWHIREICAAVEQIEQMIQAKRGTAARLIVEAPPRHGKSQIISRCTPLWYLGRHPDHEVIVATYGQDLANDLGRWAKMALSNPAIVGIFPGLKLRSDSRAADRLDTTKGGGIRYVGVGGPITGRGAHLAIIDDPIKGSEDADSESMSNALWDWYTSVLRTRLAPGGGIIVLHTRWRTNDLIGRLLKAQAAGEGEKFRRLTFTAIARPEDPWNRPEGQALHPQRYTAEDLRALQLSLPPRDWMALYQQDPMLEEGNIFKLTDFHLFKPGTAPRNLHWYIACDLGASAKKSANPSVIWPFGIDADGCIWFSPDFVHARVDTAQAIEDILRLAKSHNANGIIIEGGQIWRSIEPNINRRMRELNAYFQIINPAPTKDKFVRSRPSHARMTQGMMRFPDTRYVRERVIPEFLFFTGINDESDDIVDAVAWAGHCAEEMILPTKGDGPGGVDEEEDTTSPVPGSYADMLRRCPTPEAADKRRHSPEKLTGGKRKAGTQFRYA